MILPHQGIKEQRRGTEVLRLPLTKSPLPLVLLLSTAVFIGETLTSSILHHLGIDEHLVEAVVDSTVLLALISPALYFFVYRPLYFQMMRTQTSEAQVRQLSQRLLQAVEEEQRRLALDLHDELGQTISALQLEMGVIQEALQRQAPQFAPQCLGVMQQLKELHCQVRSIAGRLRPTLLDDLGIVPALESLLDDLRGSYRGVAINLQVAGLKSRPQPEVETVIYRLCQEGLTNALRHAQAQHIEILLTASHPELILTIRDDGIGFSPEPGSFRHPAGGLGLLGMRERVSGLGGSFHLQSAPGQGTRIRITLPYVSTHHDADSHSDR